jgi:hypothetical protein
MAAVEHDKPSSYKRSLSPSRSTSHKRSLSSSRSTSQKKASLQRAPFQHAYLISGHGANHFSIDGRHLTNGKIRVPDDCMVITLAHPGQWMYIDKIGKCVANMIKMDINVLLDPLQHSNQIVKNFGPVTYYKPGSLCPNFGYVLANVFNIKKGGKHHYSARLPGSGVIDIHKLKQYADSTKTMNEIFTQDVLDTIHNAADIRNKISYMYSLSEFPKEADVKQDIRDYIKVQLQSHKIYGASPIKETIQSTLKQLLEQSDIVKTDQYTLFHTNPKPLRIYYNFVCRDIPDMQEILYNNQQQPRSLTHIPSRRSIKKNNNMAHGSQKKGKLRALLEERIGNTFNRTRQLRNYYTSTNYVPYQKKEHPQEYIDKILQQMDEGVHETQMELDKTRIELQDAKKEHPVDHTRVTMLDAKIIEYKKDIAYIKKDRIDFIRNGTLENGAIENEGK